MSEQQLNTAITPAENQPVLCKMGCGFFGSKTSGDCCSKCWNQLQRTNEDQPTESCSSNSTTPAAVEKPIAAPSSPVKKIDTPALVAAESPIKPKKLSKKKKKKASSYKSIMAGITQGSDKDIEKEKLAIRRVTGGGAFSKIDKI